MEVVNQKEYLKKYLSGKKDKKKKRKKDIVSDRVKIIDDDIDLSKLGTADNNEDLYGPNEDAPQIVGVIDDRPMHMRIDDYRKSHLWKPLGAAEDSQDEKVVVKSDKEILLTLFKKESLNLKTKIKYLTKPEIKPPAETPKKKSKIVDDDSSPPRKNSDDLSVLRRSESRTRDVPRQSRWNIGNNEPNDSDDNTPRDIDISPPRKSRRDSDASPARKSEKDISPPRKSRKVVDSSPPRKQKSRFSEKRRDRSPQRSSPPRRKLLPGDKKGKYLIPAKRMTKTLDGKKAGLQNAQELVQENQAFKRREDEMFKNMSSEMSGANAATVIRDRKTGKIRDLEKEAQERKEKEKQDEANKEKYMRWGKGLKQVEDYENKLQQDLHEMNKPLARYADDEDLEQYLKERDREGDPMLDYIKKKRRKNDIETGKPLKQQFEGEFMPNRFGIRPGHRWDGVNRSNGFEKKWIETQNAKNAIQEEIYKWSTEDM